MNYRAVCWWALLFFAFGNVEAQELTRKQDHVDWRFSSVEQSGSQWKLVFTAVIDRGWHLYSQNTPEGGPMPVTFKFSKDESYRLSGKVKESGLLKKGYDDVFMTDVLWYEETVIFSQVVKVGSRCTVKGEVDYSVCSEEMCIPGVVRFSLDVGR